MDAEEGLSVRHFYAKAGIDVFEERRQVLHTRNQESRCGPSFPSIPSAKSNESVPLSPSSLFESFIRLSTAIPRERHPISNLIPLISECLSLTDVQ